MNLDVKILGPGCAKCKMLKRHTLKAVEELAKESPETPVTVQHVMELGEILRYDILSTPAPVINGRIIAIVKSCAPKKFWRTCGRRASVA